MKTRKNLQYNSEFPKITLLGSRAILIFVGDELLSGKQVNTTASPLAAFLKVANLSVTAMHTVGDIPNEIASCLKSCEADVVIVSGGLGPTSDDVTMQGAAEAFEVPLELDVGHAKHLKNFYAKRYKKDSSFKEKLEVESKQKNNPSGVKNFQQQELFISSEMRIKRQASIPIGATSITHSFGTAPVVLFVQKNVPYIFLAGVPYESLNIMEKHVLPWLRSIQNRKSRDVYSFSFTVYGQVESQLENEIQAIAQSLKIKLPSLSINAGEKNVDESSERKLSISYLPRGGREVQITISGNKFVAKNFVQQVVKHFAAQKELLVCEGNFTSVEKLHDVLLCLTKRSTVELGFAESCTGGLLSAMVTKQAGSSKYFYGTAVTYSNDAKSKLIKVSKTTLQKYGDVSCEVALEMAEGIATLLDKNQSAVSKKSKGVADSNVLTIACGITGIAGPKGGSKAKPVGTVSISFIIRGMIEKKKISVRTAEFYHFLGERELVRVNACRKVFSTLLFLLREVGIFQPSLSFLEKDVKA